MADIFVSYKRADQQEVALIIALLESQGWTVWWDTRINGGETWDEVIERELAAARCVVVVWSAGSVGSRWVREEAGEGRDRSILVPVHIDYSEPPLGFKMIQSISLTNWRGDASDSAVQRLIGAVTEILGRPTLISDATPRNASDDTPARAGPSLREAHEQALRRAHEEAQIIAALMEQNDATRKWTDRYESIQKKELRARTQVATACFATATALVVVMPLIVRDFSTLLFGVELKAYFGMLVVAACASLIAAVSFFLKLRRLQRQHHL